MKKLLKKDFLLFYKTAGPFCCFIASLTTPLICCIMYSDFESDIVEELLSASFIFMSPMTVSIIISLLLTSSFAVEIKDKTIIYLLANGFRQQDIWTSKLAVAFICSYFTLIFSNVIFEIAVYLQWGIWISLSIEQVLLVMVIFPFISLAFSSALWLLMWTTKSLGNMLSSVFPAGLYMFSMYFCQKLVDKNININWYIIVAVIIITLGIFVLIGSGVDRVSKEYWINIHR